MARYCMNCGKELDDSALFCSDCGSKQIPPINFDSEETVFAQDNLNAVSTDANTVAAKNDPTIDTVISGTTPPNNYSEPQQINHNRQQFFAPVQSFDNPPPVQQIHQQPEAPKKSNSALIAAVCAVTLCVVIIATVVILLATGTLTFNKDKDNDKKENSSVSETVGNENEDNFTPTVSPEAPTELPSYDFDAPPPDNPIDIRIPYTKGEVRSGEYINEWAGFKFRIPSDYPEANISVYNSYNASLPSGEFGYISINDTSGKALSIGFENNPTNMTAEQVLNSTIKLTTAILEDINPIEYGKLETINICGEEYTSSTMHYPRTEIYGITAVRIIDNKVLTIVITGSSLNECMSVLNSFEEAYPSI